MIDANFTIHLINYNNTTINSYSIKVNNDIREGIFNKSHKEIYLINDTKIYEMLIIINNETVLNVDSILIVSGITHDNIKRIKEPYTINLNPAEWTAKEWNIVFGLIIGAILMLIFSYRLVKRIRKKYGVKTIR